VQLAERGTGELSAHRAWNDSRSFDSAALAYAAELAREQSLALPA
jgi:hypothetical protein